MSILLIAPKSFCTIPIHSPILCPSTMGSLLYFLLAHAVLGFQRAGLAYQRNYKSRKDGRGL
ncbi:Scavenger mRNA decapping enzyme C-term binding family protein [Aspergillus niger]|uniref:Scavenger mRNA decapping enzyme C-term binding family protein n=1 Tax=Aspergillus niger TaxID=5061 RepID=A0A505I9R5_ASPNG|nr:Scavenger mRNA decapping enzyme C-term binding family protein [Aspergillus niger]